MTLIQLKNANYKSLSRDRYRWIPGWVGSDDELQGGCHARMLTANEAQFWVLCVLTWQAGGLRELLFNRALRSWPDYLPNVPATNTISLEVKFQHMNFGRHTRAAHRTSWPLPLEIPVKESQPFVPRLNIGLSANETTLFSYETQPQSN